MSENRIITHDKLFQKLEDDQTSDKIKIAAQLLLTSINDWPTLNLSEPSEFLKELSKEIGRPLTVEKIENYSKILKTDKSAWKMESLSSLLQVFEYDRTKTLENIIDEISNHYGI